MCVMSVPYKWSQVYRICFVLSKMTTIYQTHYSPGAVGAMDCWTDAECCAKHDTIHAVV